MKIEEDCDGVVRIGTVDCENGGESSRGVIRLEVKDFQCY